MKQILLFMTDFYGYNNEIIKELNNQNYNVTFFLDKIKLTLKDRILGKFDKNYLNKKFSKYFNECLKTIENKKFDMILIIFGGNFFRKEHIEILRKNFSNTKIVYYAWDSVKNFPLIKDLLLESDISYTFDPEDARKYNSKFLPLFYVNKSPLKTKNIYDISTVMSFFSEKAENLNNVLSVIPKDLNTFIYLKVRDKLYYWKLKICDRHKIKELEKFFEYETLDKEKVYNIFLNSKAVIDCPLPNQNGMTMRTFEVLSFNKKLITTNRNIVNYDFYTPDNIFIVEKGKMLPNNFLNSSFNEDFALSEKYSIKSFIRTLTQI